MYFTNCAVTLYVQHWNQMANSLVTLCGWIWVWQTQRRNQTPWMNLCLLKSNLYCLYNTLFKKNNKNFYLWSTLYSLKVSQELFESKLVVYLIFYQSKRFFRKGFDLKLRWEIYLGIVYGSLCTECVACLHVFVFASNS